MCADTRAFFAVAALNNFHLHRPQLENFYYDTFAMTHVYRAKTNLFNDLIILFLYFWMDASASYYTNLII